MSKIYCPNCKHTGNAENKGRGTTIWLGFLILFGISCIAPGLFLVTIPTFFWLLLGSREKICSVCKWNNPIPLDHYQNMTIRSEGLKKRESVTEGSSTSFL